MTCVYVGVRAPAAILQVLVTEICKIPVSGYSAQAETAADYELRTHDHVKGSSNTTKLVSTEDPLAGGWTRSKSDKPQHRQTAYHDVICPQAGYGNPPCQATLCCV